MLSSLSPSVDSLSSLILLLGPRLYPMCLAQCAGLHLCCQIHVQFRTLLARFRFPFCRFVVVHSSQVHLVWLYDHHLRRVLVASYRPPFVLIRSYIWIQAALLRIAAPANFPTSPPALYRVFDTFPTLFLESGPHLQPHHNGGAAPNVLTLTYLIHLLLSSLCS